MIMYREHDDVNSIIYEVIKGTPQVNVEHENVVHRIWCVSDAEVTRNNIT